MQLDPTPDLGADCCDATIALAARFGGARVCPVCSTEYRGEVVDRPALVPAAPAVAEAAPRSLRGAVADVRVQVADGERLRPSSVAPVERLTHVEDPELVDVRRLLTELRPERGGPLGWPADGAPPAAMGSSWTPAVRVQTSAEVPAILPGAFASHAAPTDAPRTIEGSALHWCQRCGTLAKGLRAFYEAAGEALAPPPVRAAWKLLAPSLRAAAAPGYGRRRVMEAMAEWWRETPFEQPSRPASEAARAGNVAEVASAQTGWAIARAARRLTGATPSGNLNDIPAPDAAVDVCPDAESPDAGAPLRG